VPAETVFLCLTCRNLFPSEDAVQQHYLHSCVASGQQPPASPTPVAHPTLDSQECQHCGHHAWDMAAHEKLHSTSVPGVLKCLSFGCKKLSFSSSALLKNHMLDHKSQLKEYCQVCGRYFTGLWQLNIHRRQHTELLQFACDVPGCNYIGDVASDLQKHERLKHGNTAFKCNYCSREFRQLIHLKWHISNHMTEKPGVYKCAHRRCAAMTFTSIDKMTNHFKDKHRQSEDLLCNVCGRSFTNSDTLATHKMQHAHNQKQLFPRQIPDHNYIGNVDSVLQTHQKIAHSDTAIVCPICSKNIKTWEALKIHKSKHITKTRGVYKCVHGNCATMTFTSTDKMTNHFRYKHAEKNVCDVCGCSFTNRDTLATHKMQHTQKKLFPCQFPDCPSTFMQVTQLRMHEKISHKLNMSKCMLCGMAVSQPAHFWPHVQKHETGQVGVVVCAYSDCKMAFLSCDYLKKHVISSHHIKPIANSRHRTKLLGPHCKFPGCSYSSKLIWSVQLHMRIVHKYDGSNKCMLCGMVLVRQRNLWSHIKKHVTDTEGVIKCAVAGCKEAFPSASELELHVKSCHGDQPSAGL